MIARCVCPVGLWQVTRVCLVRYAVPVVFRIHSCDLLMISMATQSRHDSTGAASAARDDDEFDSSTYECNICYEVAAEPVVTMCGHLYCWPCLYRYASYTCAALASPSAMARMWIQVDASSERVQSLSCLQSWYS